VQLVDVDEFECWMVTKCPGSESPDATEAVDTNSCHDLIKAWRGIELNSLEVNDK
jgi:hypothetical protein